jgi:hypothetical protein
LTEDYYRVKSRKGGHTFVMDDGSVLGTDQLVRLRTAQGHQILMHDTEETIYISHAKGNSWVELTADGSINIYGKNGFNLRSEGNINIHSDQNINMNAQGNINMRTHGNAVVLTTNASGNLSTTVNSLPDSYFNANTGTWYSQANSISTISTVAPTHEPFIRG